MSTPLPDQPTSQPTPDPETQPDQPLDSAQLHVKSLIYQAVYKAHGYTRMPGSVYIDENGDVA
jgi:hypothetical protein